MPFTPRNDHAPRFADGLAGQNPAARTTPVAPFWPPGLPEGRTGRRGYPLLVPRQAGTPAGWTNHRNTGPDQSRKNRVAQTDRQPDGATKSDPPADQKARTCDRPDFAKGQTGQPCRTGQPWPIVSSEPAARHALALSSLAPNAKAKGRGRTKPGENRPKHNPASP